MQVHWIMLFYFGSAIFFNWGIKDWRDYRLYSMILLGNLWFW
jgi:hypothetical protein